MNTITDAIDLARTKRIALISDDAAKAELVGDAFAFIADSDGAPSDADGARAFARMSIATYSSTDRAHAKLFTDAQACASLGLVVLDGMVRKETSGGAPGNGSAAVSLLDWLNEALPEVPVVVLVSSRVEGLDLRLLKRRNITSLNIREMDFNAAFRRALDGVVRSGPPALRRLTVEVGEYEARYYMLDGSDVRDQGSYQYRNMTELLYLLDKTNSYSPMSDGLAVPDWQTYFAELGEEIFNSFIQGTIGHYILGHFQDSDDSDETPPEPVELRIDIDVGSDECARLFGLPFELAKPPEYLDSFLCTRVPMARRIRFRKGTGAGGAQKAKRLADAPHPPRRVLFINASFQGEAIVQHEVTGKPVPISKLNRLLNTPDELEVVQSFATPEESYALDAVTVVGSKRGETARELAKQMQRLVSNEKFDILHFSGHSITLPDNGGTFLIFPDKSGVGRGVSMRVVADWVREAGIRMVLLSSCSSSSLRTAIELMRTKADAVIGFRWDVNDHACVEYFENFYRMYVKQRKSIAEAYCGACRKVRMSSHGLPIWASAIAVVKD